MAIAGIAFVVAATWAPSFVAPLGDNHEGRVDARFALQVQNLHDQGLSASGWASSMAPYAGRYANHPPGPNATQAAVAEVAGRGAAQVRIFPYLAGLLALPAAAWLLLALGVRRSATVGAVALLACTPLYWCYGRLLWDVPLLFAAPAAILSARSDRRPGLVLAAVLVMTAVVMSWIGAATAGVFMVVRQIRRRRSPRDSRAAVVLVGAWLLGATLSGLWFRAAAAGGLAEQVEFRTTAGSFTTGEFLHRQLQNLLDLVPAWTIALLPVGGWAALRTRRPVRLPLAASGALGVLFVVLLPNGSYIHDYWIYPLLVPVTIAAALAVEVIQDRLEPRLRAATVAGGATVVGALLVVALAVGGVGRSYFREPEAAGRLAERSAPAVDQATAWTANGVETARWLSWYWDLPTEPLDADTLATAPRQDLVLVAWPLPPPLTDTPAVDRDGGYALVRIGELRDRCEAAPAGC